MDCPVEYGADDIESETVGEEYDNETNDMGPANGEEVLPWRAAKTVAARPRINLEAHGPINRWERINSEDVSADFLSVSPRGETSKLIIGYLAGVIGKQFRGLQEADIENAASDAYLSAYLGRKGFRRTSELTTWLYKIAFRAANRIHNKNKKNEFTSLDVLKEVSDWDPVSPDDPFSDVEISAAVAAAAADRLTENEARAFYLCSEMDCSHAEAAEIEGCSANAMASRLSGALKKLRAYFRDVYEWDIPEPTDGRARRSTRNTGTNSAAELATENTSEVQKIEEDKE